MTLVERSVEVYIPLFRELRHAVVGRYYEVDAVEDGRAAYLAEEVCQCRVDMLYRRYYLVRVGAVLVHDGIGLLEVPHNEIGYAPVGRLAAHAGHYPVGTLEVRRLVGIARPYRCLTASNLDVAAGPHVYMRRSALTLGRVPYRVAAPEAGRSGVGVLEYRHLATDRAVVESVVHDVVAVGVQSGGHGVVVGKGVGRKYRIGLGEDTDAAQRVERRRVASLGQVPAESVHREYYYVMFVVRRAAVASSGLLCPCCG